MGKLEDLEVLQKLKESGAITDDEFQKVKNKILADDIKAIDSNNKIKEDVNEINHKESVTDQLKEQANIETSINNKVCIKCGNEIKEGNTFCTNCGTSVNKVQKNSKLKEYKIPIIIIIIWIVITCIIVGIQVIINKRDNTNYINNEVNTNTNITSNNDKAVVQKTDNKLSIIDEENKELKINANELMKAIITANKVKAENDRSMYFEYTRKLLSSIGKYNTYGVRKFRYTWYIDRLSIFNC